MRKKNKHEEGKTTSVMMKNNKHKKRKATTSATRKTIRNLTRIAITNMKMRITSIAKKQ
jgi:hypothetical protein